MQNLNSRIVVTKKLSFLFVILSCILLVACNLEGRKKVYEDEGAVTFIGMIEEIHDHTALVYVEEGEGAEGWSILVNLLVNDKKTFQVGERIKVGFDGTILESNPAQINTLFVESITNP